MSLALALVAIGLAGIATDRHLIVILLSVELIFIASIVALVGFFVGNVPTNPDAVIMLLSIFAVASVEIIALVTFYVYMKQRHADFDVTKLSKLKW